MSLYYYKTPNGQRGVRRGSPRINSVGSLRPLKPSHPYDKVSQLEHDIPWTQPVLRNALAYPFAQCFAPAYYDFHNPYQTPFHSLQHPMGDQQSSMNNMASLSTPKLTPLMNLTETAETVPHLSLNDAAIPLPAAANQLHAAVSQAITFFDHFYRSFRKSVGDMKTLGDKDLLNKIWETRIRSSMVDPTKDRAQQARHNDSHHGAEDLSFPQHQKRVLERNDALLHARYSNVPLAAAQVSASAWPDQELQAHQQRHRAAEALKRKVRSGTEELRYAVGAMARDYEMAKTAIRELKCLRQTLVTFRACWRRDWKLEDDDGNDSDDEGEGGQDGEGQGQESY